MAGFKLFNTTGNKNKKQPGGPWRDDFCLHLAAIYEVPHSSFQIDFKPYCNDLSVWLNQYSLTSTSPVPDPKKTPVDHIIAQTPTATGSNKKITIKKDEIKLDKQALDLTTALEMAFLAKANPEMAAQGVELTGTDEEQFMLFMAAQIMGLKIKNPPTQIPSKLGQNIQNDMKQALNDFVQKMDTGGQAFEKQRLQEVFDIAIDNTLHHDVKNILGNVDEQTYKKAKQQVWQDQNISLSKLQKDFKIGAAKAKNIRDAMVKEDFIFWPSAPGARQYKVSIDTKGQLVSNP